MKHLIFVVLLPIYVVIYSSITSGYPYYAFWDSTIVYAIDAMITRSGQLPDHFFHPNLVPLILNGYVFLPIGKLLGLISIDSITDLKLVQNPYLSFVETVNYLIAIGALFAYFFVGSVYLVVTKLINPFLANLGSVEKYLTVAILLIASLTWQGLPNMLIWIRYETYGIVFLFFSIFFILRAASAPNILLTCFISGIFAGAAILSKIQLIGGVLSIPFLYFAISSQNLLITKATFLKTIIPLALSCFVLFTLFHTMSYLDIRDKTIIPIGFSAGITPDKFFPIAPLISFIFLLITFFVARNYSQTPKIVSSVIYILVIYCAGIITVFFSAAIIGSNWQEKKSALEYTYMYSLMFAQLYHPGIKNDITLLQNLYINKNAIIFLMSGVVFIGFLRSMDRNNALTWRQYLFGALTILIVILSSLLLIRQGEFQKDILLYDSLNFFCGAILARLFLLLFLEKLKVAIIFCLVAALYFSLVQFNGLLLNHKTISIHNYNYQIPPWRDFSFGYRQNQYRELMADAYPLPETWSTAFSAAKKINSTKLILDQLFRNKEIKISNTSLGAEGAFLNNTRTERIKKLSPELKGSIIVPLIKKNSTVEVLSRSDLLIYILTTDPSIQMTEQVEPVNLIFETDEGLSGKKYYAYILKSGGIRISLNDLPIYIAIKSD